MKKLALFSSRPAYFKRNLQSSRCAYGAPAWKIAQNFANGEKRENQKINSNKHHNENSDQEEF